MADPDRVDERIALDAWRQGEAALNEGRASEAEAAFQVALERQPGDPLLIAWQARARAASGDLQGAIQLLDVVLGREPAFSEARYNRAAYAARLGELDRAALDLQRALAEGARDPREVLLDADFQPHLADRRFAFLPSAPLDVTLRGPGGSVFVGSDASIRLVVTGLGLDQVQLSVPDLHGPFRLTRVEERIETLEGGDERLTLTWTIRVLGAGQATVGPIEVSSGKRVVTTPPDTLLSLAPDTHSPPPPGALSLLRPSSISPSAPTASAVAWRDDAGRLIVRTSAATRVRRTDPGAPPSVRASFVTGREQAWGLEIWPSAPTTATLEVSEGGRVVFSGSP